MEGFDEETLNRLNSAMSKLQKAWWSLLNKRDDEYCNYCEEQVLAEHGWESHVRELYKIVVPDDEDCVYYDDFKEHYAVLNGDWRVYDDERAVEALLTELKRGRR